MSQNSIGKEEVSVKKEPGISGLADNGASNTGSTSNSSAGSNTASSGTSSKYSAADGWQDIPLKCCTKEETEDIRYHLMRFLTKQNVDIVKNFEKPVRLHRKDPRNIQFQLTRKEIDQRKREQEASGGSGSNAPFARRQRDNGMDSSGENRVKNEDDDGDSNMVDEAGPDGEVPGVKQEGDAEKQGEAADSRPKDGSIAPEEGDDKNKDMKKDKNKPDMSQVAPDGGARKSKKAVFKRKTRQINLMDDNKRKLRYEEYYPWVVEDYEGKNVFVGSYEAGASDTTTVLFVFDKDGFKMVPTEKVYRFTPRNKYATLTLEEAESRMEKNSLVPRWLMRRMEDNANTGGVVDSRFRNSTSASGIIAPAGGSAASKRRLRTVTGEDNSGERDSDRDELDYDEEFADDEEAPVMDGDEEENKFVERKMKKEMLKAAHFDAQEDVGSDEDIDDLFETEKSRKVNADGKKLKKVLHKTEGGVYDSDDEDEKLNPYLSKSDLESDDESDSETAVKPEPTDGEYVKSEVPAARVFTANYLGDSFVVVRAPKAFLSGFPAGEWNPTTGVKRPLPAAVESPRKRVKTEDGTPKLKINIKKENGASGSTPRNTPSPGSRAHTSSPTPGLVDLSSSGPDGNLVTTNDVLDIVRETPLTTKELLMKLKAKVNAHTDNRSRIISIVRLNLRLVEGKLVLKD